MTDHVGTRNGGSGVPTRPFMVAVQSSRIPIILINVLASGSYIAIANPSFLAMTGLAPAAVLGQPVAQALADTADRSDIDIIEARLAASQPATWDLALVRSDGARCQASALLHALREQAGGQRQHLISFYPSDGGDDQPRGMPGASLELYKHAPGFIAMSKGPQHHIIFANESYRQFVGQRQLEGLPVAEAMPEIAAQGFVEILDRVFRTGVAYRGETVAFDLAEPNSGNVTRRYADFVYEPMRDADLNIVGIFCEGYDVTEQQEAEAALLTLQTEIAHASRVNAMGTIAATLAHELNQPLSAILNYASGALRHLDRDTANVESAEQALTSIELAAQRAGAIIRTLRDLTDRRARASEIFELEAVVAESINLIRTACPLGMEIGSNIPPKMLLQSDRIQIQQVIINLLRNGCDAVASSAIQKISISAETTAEEIVVSVRDTGPGVSAEAAESMFTWSDTTKEGGMGLGLSISRTIIEGQGGRIWLERSDETGSEFRFTLPKISADPSEAAN